MPNATQTGHEITEIRDDSRDFLSDDSYEKGPYRLRGISSKINVPRKAAVELILQLEC